MSEFKANWNIAPDWATKFGKKHVVHDQYIPVWYNHERACSATDCPNRELLQAMQYLPVNIEFIENRPVQPNWK